MIEQDPQSIELRFLVEQEHQYTLEQALQQTLKR